MEHAENESVASQAASTHGSGIFISEWVMMPGTFNHIAAPQLMRKTAYAVLRRLSCKAHSFHSESDTGLQI
jgi:hypothetical protein